MQQVRARVVLFGDSLTQRGSERGFGWASLLADHYVRKADIINRGYSGYNTQWALRAVEEIFPKEDPSPLLVTVFFGANDSALSSGGSARQHVPVQQYKENLRTIVKTITAGPDPKPCVVLITPPPVDEAARIEYGRELCAAEGLEFSGVAERTNDEAHTYAKAALEVGEEFHTVRVDLWTQLQADPNWRSLLNDGLHFTPDGNRRVFEALLSALEKEAPGVLPTSLPYDFPTHNVIGITGPEEVVFADFEAKRREAISERIAKGPGWWRTLPASTY